MLYFSYEFRFCCNNALLPPSSIVICTQTDGQNISAKTITAYVQLPKQQLDAKRIKQENARLRCPMQSAVCRERYVVGLNLA